MSPSSPTSPPASQPEPFRATVRSMLRDRLLDAAAYAFSKEGWRRLTMATIADRAGVSRQTVYNEFGSKQSLAEQLVMRELDVFLDVVRQRITEEDDFTAGVRAAVDGALELAEDNALLRSVLESGHTGDTELLPYIFQSQGLIDRATDFLHELVVVKFPDLPLQGARLSVALETVVRLVLSPVTQPSRPRGETADDIAWLIGTVVAGARTVPPIS